MVLNDDSFATLVAVLAQGRAGRTSPFWRAATGSRLPDTGW